MRITKKARRSWIRRKGDYRTIDRNGCVYYVRGDYELLNPEVLEGTGLAFVKPDDPREVVGVFKTSGPWPTDVEAAQAQYAYLCAVGRPRKGAVVVPASFFRDCIEQTPENIETLREAGAFWVRPAEECGSDG